jgi:hypothetical protein
MITLSLSLAVLLIVTAVTIAVHRYLPSPEGKQTQDRRAELEIELPKLAPLPALSGAYMWAHPGMVPWHKDRWVNASSLRGEPWEYISSVFEQAAAKMVPSLFVLLTDQPAGEAARIAYVIHEPFDSSVHQATVIALSYTEKEVCIYADGELWGTFDAEYRELTRQAEQLLKRGMVIEALVFSFLEVRKLSGSGI